MYMRVGVYEYMYRMNSDQQITSLAVLEPKHVSKKTLPSTTVLRHKELWERAMAWMEMLSQVI